MSEVPLYWWWWWWWWWWGCMAVRSGWTGPPRLGMDRGGIDKTRRDRKIICSGRSSVQLIHHDMHVGTYTDVHACLALQTPGRAPAPRKKISDTRPAKPERARLGARPGRTISRRARPGLTGRGSHVGANTRVGCVCPVCATSASPQQSLTLLTIKLDREIGRD